MTFPGSAGRLDSGGVGLVFVLPTIDAPVTSNRAPAGATTGGYTSARSFGVKGIGAAQPGLRCVCKEGHREVERWWSEQMRENTFGKSLIPGQRRKSWQIKSAASLVGTEMSAKSSAKF